MLHHRGNSGSKLFGEWHSTREEKRRETHDENTSSNIERERFDLDTARIGRGDNPENYEVRPYTGEPEDIRETNERI